MKNWNHVTSTVSKFKNKYENERIFLIGNGPSLSQTELSKLNSEYTMALNKISHIYSDTSWRPTFYFFGNRPSWVHNRRNDEKDTFIQDNIDLGIPCFLNTHILYEQIVEPKKNTHFFHQDDLLKYPNILHRSSISELKQEDISILESVWSDEISEKIFAYHSMYSMLQLAVYMGFSKIYLIGCDLGYEYRNPHMIFDNGLDPHKQMKNNNSNKYKYIRKSFDQHNTFHSLVNGVYYKLIKNKMSNKILHEIKGSSMTDHFSEKYIDKLQIKDKRYANEEMKKKFYVAKRICSEKNVNIYNCTSRRRTRTISKKKYRQCD